MVSDNLVLIPGAGGVGRTIFEQLRTQQVPVRFMVRREDERARSADLERGARVPRVPAKLSTQACKAHQSGQSRVDRRRM